MDEVLLLVSYLLILLLEVLLHFRSIFPGHFVVSRTKERKSIPRLQNWHKQFNFLQKCTDKISVQNFTNFCMMRSEGKSRKFSEGDARDSPHKNTICEGKFGKTEIKLRSFVRKRTIFRFPGLFYPIQPKGRRTAAKNWMF